MSFPLSQFLSGRVAWAQVVLVIIGVAWPTIAAEAANLHEGLVAYWSLDEAEGSVVTDVFGADSDVGALRESPTWLRPADARLGESALEFDGFSQDVLIPRSTDLDITKNAVTVSAWVNIEFLPSELFEDFAGIYDSNEDNYVLYLDRTNQELRFKVTDVSGDAERPGVPESMLTAGEWHHVMGVYDGENTVAKIYFDGVFIDSHVNSSLADNVRPGQLAGIGANPTGVDVPSQYFFTGAIDDVAVWDRPLGRAEAVYLFNGGTGTAVGAANPNIDPIPDRPPVVPIEPAVDPVIYYAFEGNLQNSGSGGSEFDGVLLDAPGINDPPFGPGKIGQGLDLSENAIAQAAVGDAVSVDYELTESGTIAFDVEVNQYYNYQSLWTNSANPDDWEMWIYNDGRVRGRVDGDAYATFDLDAVGGLDKSHHIAFTWEREDGNVAVRLYVDGELREEDPVGTWIDPGTTFFIGGGDGTNHFGAGIWDEFRIYDVVLSEAEILYLAGTGIVGDFDGDGQLTANDLDQMADGMIAGDAEYDLDGDGDADIDDRIFWVNDLAETWMGDSDLNGEFDSLDFVAVFVTGKYETGEEAIWAEGDWDGDKLFSSGDFVEAFTNGGYEMGPKSEQLNLVPEPSSLVLLLLALAGVTRLRRRS